MDDRKRTLLALGITEYDSTLAALLALRRGGQSVPQDVLNVIRFELRLLSARWGSPNATDAAREAREWVTAHPEEVMALQEEQE